MVAAGPAWRAAAAPAPCARPRVPIALAARCRRRGQSNAEGERRIRGKGFSEKLLGGKKSIVKKIEGGKAVAAAPSPDAIPLL